jgi:hypothetical protein
MKKSGRRAGGGWLRPPTWAIGPGAFGFVLLLIATASVGARAEETASGTAGSESEDVLSVPGRALPGEPGGAGKGEPGLDDLLKLPTGFMTKEDPRPVAGASEDEWRRRFTRAEKAIGEARESLAETRRELDGLAETGGASQWSVAPPGAAGQTAGDGNSPLSFKLRQELVRNREALDEAEKALRELRIEADLAGVPAEWRVVAASPSAPTVEN